MSDIQKRMADIAEEIENGKTKKANLEGRRSELKKQLREVLGVKTIEEAEEKLRELESECDDLEKSIENGLKKLEKEYKWEEN